MVLSSLSIAAASSYALFAGPLASVVVAEINVIESLAAAISGSDTPSFIAVAAVRVMLALAIAVATGIVSHFLSKAVKKVIARVNENLPTAIFVNIVRVGVWCTGIAIILSTCFGVNPSGIIAALGVGGIAISLGMQDTIANIIGGLELSTMGTLKKGDHVVVGSTEGIVEDIAWRETTIVGFSGERTIVPNKVLNSNSLTVLPPARKVKVPVQIPNETVEAFRSRGIMLDEVGEGIALAVSKRLREPAPEGMGLVLQHEAVVQFGSLTDFAASATVIVWIEEGMEFDRFEVISAITASAADASSVDTCPVDAPAADAPVADASAAETSLAETSSADASPADASPVDCGQQDAATQISEP